MAGGADYGVQPRAAVAVVLSAYCRSKIYVVVLVQR